MSVELDRWGEFVRRYTEHLRVKEKSGKASHKEFETAKEHEEFALSYRVMVFLLLLHDMSKADLAKKLHKASSQTINNWRKRGVPQSRAIELSRLLYAPAWMFIEEAPEWDVSEEELKQVMDEVLNDVEIHIKHAHEQVRRQHIQAVRGEEFKEKPINPPNSDMTLDSGAVREQLHSLVDMLEPDTVLPAMLHLIDMLKKQGKS